MRNAVVQRISVPFEYPVVFTERAFAADNPALEEVVRAREPARRHRLLFVVDGGVAAAWPTLRADIAAYVEARRAHLELLADPWVVAGGEACKNDERATATLHGMLDRLAVDRQSFVVAVGGGAVLDMAGYAAATAHRGVRVVRVPSTVLAQADSAVGVKNGINAFGKKNFLGTFAPPFGVIVDFALLATLERRDTLAGMAEAVKVALVRDRAFFEWIEGQVAALARCEAGPLAELVRRSAELHMAHIAGGGDPFEMGSARPLDYGHWSAHKLESLTAHRLRHGEAVAIGMALDALYSEEQGLCEPRLAERVLAVLRGLGLPLWDEALLEERAGRPRVFDGLAEFREHLGGELTLTLLREPGRGVEVHEVDEARMRAALVRLRVEAHAPRPPASPRGQEAGA